jgi:flagellar biosynthesis protein FlhG
LQIIPGTGDTLQTSNMTYQEKQRLLRGLGDIDADVLLIDVGAGTSYHALDFFMQSDIQICVTLPDPTAIMDLYTFLQLATIRRVLSGFLSQSDVASALKKHSFKSLQEVFELAEATREGAKEQGQQALKFFHPLLIINRDRENGSVNINKLRKMVTKYLGIDIPELGNIPEDNIIHDALKAFMPISELTPSAPASLALTAISERTDKIVELFSQHNNGN